MLSIHKTTLLIAITDSGPASNNSSLNPQEVRRNEKIFNLINIKNCQIYNSILNKYKSIIAGFSILLTILFVARYFIMLRILHILV